MPSSICTANRRHILITITNSFLNVNLFLFKKPYSSYINKNKMEIFVVEKRIFFPHILFLLRLAYISFWWKLIINRILFNIFNLFNSILFLQINLFNIKKKFIKFIFWENNMLSMHIRKWLYYLIIRKFTARCTNINYGLISFLLNLKEIFIFSNLFNNAKAKSLKGLLFFLDPFLKRFLTSLYTFFNRKFDLT